MENIFWSSLNSLTIASWWKILNSLSELPMNYEKTVTLKSEKQKNGERKITNELRNNPTISYWQTHVDSKVWNFYIEDGENKYMLIQRYEIFKWKMEKIHWTMFAIFQACKNLGK